MSFHFALLYQLYIVGILATVVTRDVPFYYTWPTVTWMLDIKLTHSREVRTTTMMKSTNKIVKLNV